MSKSGAEGIPPGPALRRVRLLLHLTWEDGDADAFVRELSVSALVLDMESPPAAGAEVRFEGQIPDSLHNEVFAGKGRVADPATAPDEGTSDVRIEVEEVFQGQAALERVLSRPPDLPPSTEEGAEGEDRRAAPRFRVGFPVRWGENRPLDRSGFMTDVSAAGAFLLASEAPLPQGTPIRLSFPVPGDGRLLEATADATITRIAWGVDSEGYGLGITFDRSRDPASALTDFLLEEIDAADRASSPPRDTSPPPPIPPPDDDGEDEAPDGVLAADGPEEEDAPRPPSPPPRETPDAAAEPVAPRPAAPPPGTAFSARKPGVEPAEGRGALLETLSDTLAGGGSVRMRSMTKILLFAMLASFLLYLVHSCMSAFE